VYNLDSFEFFDVSLKMRSDEALNSNTYADYAVVFGYENSENYYYMLFIHDHFGGNRIFKVTNGVRTEIEGLYGQGLIQDNNFHSVQITYDGIALNVLLDGVTYLTAEGLIIPEGKIGFGSRNDAFSVDDVVITKLKAVEDVNDDGVIDVADVNLVKDQTLEIIAQTDAGDVNRSGDVNAVDVQRVINALE